MPLAKLLSWLKHAPQLHSVPMPIHMPMVRPSWPWLFTFELFQMACSRS